jgi:hypothetical protein
MHRVDTKMILSNNLSNKQDSSDVEAERTRDMEVRRAAIQLAASIAKKWELASCDCCGKKLF